MYRKTYTMLPWCHNDLEKLLKLQNIRTHIQGVFFSLLKNLAIIEFLSFSVIYIRQLLKKNEPWLQKRLLRQTGANTSGVVNTSDILCKSTKIKHCFQWCNHLRMKVGTEVYDRICSEVITKSKKVTAVTKASIEYHVLLLQTLPLHSPSYISHLNLTSYIREEKAYTFPW